MSKSKSLMIKVTETADAPHVIDYMKKVLAETDYLSMEPDEFSFSVEEEEKAINRFKIVENWLMLSAVIDEEIVGMLTFNGGVRKAYAHAGVVGISVLKSHWRRGIGRALFDTLFDWANKSLTIKKINLSVREDNLSAIALYRDLGFEIEGVDRMKHYKDGKYFDSIIMGKIL